LVNALEKKYKARSWSFFHFDSIGVPSVAEMKEEFGTPSRWQEVKTNEWIDKLVNECHEEKIFFEGQVNLQFVHNAFQKHDFRNYKIILLDCREEKMAHRLTDRLISFSFRVGSFELCRIQGRSIPYWKFISDVRVCRRDSKTARFVR
jgi:hypothetical protein